MSTCHRRHFPLTRGDTCRQSACFHSNETSLVLGHSHLSSQRDWEDTFNLSEPSLHLPLWVQN